MNKRQLRVFLSDSNNEWLSKEITNTGMTATQVINETIQYAIRAKETKNEEAHTGHLD